MNLAAELQRLVAIKKAERAPLYGEPSLAIAPLAGFDKTATCPSCKRKFLTAKGLHSNRRCTPCRVVYEKLSRSAHADVHDAIMRGDLRPAHEFPCTDCAGVAVEYDHRDYSQPLKVDPVCHGCNLKRGPASIANFLTV